jgi:hypothetical protein
VIGTFQRWYAFAVLLLRDFFRRSPSSRLAEWKTLTIISISESCLIVAAMLMVAVASGSFGLVRSTGAFLSCGVVVLVIVHWANRQAEQRLLPRFEGEYRRLGRPRRVVATIGVIMLLALMVCAALASATVVRKKLTSSYGVSTAYPTSETDKRLGQ